jgi:ribonuclease BN (tRNA processing enzyme)
MKLTVLGGSAASPNSGMGCSGYLVQCGETRLLIDPGPGTLQELRRHADFRTLAAVLVSHTHLDHMLDLLALRHALAYNPIPAPAAIPVWLPPGGAAFLARAAAPFDECDVPGRFTSTVDVREYDPMSPLDIGDCRVTFARTVHYVPAWAMRIVDREEKSLGYTADTGPAADLDAFVAGVDLLLAEATLLTAGGHDAPMRGSLTAREAATLARDAGAGGLILTHYWEEHGPESLRQEAAAVYPGPLALAQPGLTIEW